MFCCTNVDAAVVGGKGFVVQHSWCVPTIEDVWWVKCVARRPIDGYRKCDEEVSRVEDESEGQNSACNGRVFDVFFNFQNRACDIV